VSSIAVNLAVPLAAIQPEIDRIIPNLSDPAWPETHKVDEGMCATWYFDRKPVRLKMDGDQLQITIPGGFGMIADPHTDIFGCSRPYASCGNKTTGQAPLPIEIRLSAAPQLARNYRLSAALHNAGTALLAPCQLGGVVNATPTIQSIIDGQIAQQLAGINQAIAARADVRPQVQAAWAAIQRPQRIADDLWLVVRPTELAGGVSAPDPDTLAVQAVARATIELVKQAAAPAVAVAPLPDLGVAPPGIAPGIHIAASGTVSYDALTKQLAAKLAGTPHDIEYPAGTTHHVVVRDVRVTGPVRCKAAKRTKCVSVALEFTGDACGALYLVGRPAIDAEKQDIIVEDLDFSVESSDALARLAWLARGPIVDQLRKQLRFSLAPAATEARGHLDRALRAKLSGDWKLSGTADAVAFQVAIGAAGLDYAIDLSGSLAVALPPPPAP
jgi:hypothetical protein